MLYVALRNIVSIDAFRSGELYATMLLLKIIAIRYCKFYNVGFINLRLNTC